MRGGSLGRNFGKSVSTSNLRKSFDPENDSILAPGAFSAGSSRYSNGGSLKRLTIDRSLRTDLFTRPAALNAPITNGTNGEEASSHQASKLKKRVSFETDSVMGDSGDKVNGAVVPVETESPEPTAVELGFLRSARTNGQQQQVNGQHPNGILSNGASASSSDTAAGGAPEMEQVRGKELAVVPEDGESASIPGTVPTCDPKPKEYWMRPSRSELSKMSRDQLKNVAGYTVGRVDCGEVTFNVPVDLNTVDLDSIFGGIVQISLRSITVYPEETQKPPRGKGLNVPSTLRIQNSWPRGKNRKISAAKSGPLFDKHVQRLMNVVNTEFIEYNKDSGVWAFMVPHFTTYGLDYDDDEDDDVDVTGESFDQSTLSAPPDTPTPKVRPQQQQHQHQQQQQPSTLLNQSFNSEMMDSTMSMDVSSLGGSMNGVEDDTFEFKKRKLVPGAFGNQEEYVDEDEDEEMGSNGGDTEEEGSFLEDGSAGSTEVDDNDNTNDDDDASEVESDEEDAKMDMAGSFPTSHLTAEQHTTTSGSPTKSRLHDTLRSTHNQFLDTPPKPRLDLSGNWTEQLQRTISPRKQDRAALRELQGNAVVGRSEMESPNKAVASNSSDARRGAGADKGFATSIDLMNSLFRRPGDQAEPLAKKQQQQDVKGKGGAKGFEV